MSEFQALAEAQEALERKYDELTACMQRIFSVGTTEVVVDGSGRKMPVEIRSIGTGTFAGYLHVTPVRGKSRRAVHWTQIERRSKGDGDE